MIVLIVQFVPAAEDFASAQSAGRKSHLLRRRVKSVIYQVDCSFRRCLPVARTIGRLIAARRPFGLATATVAWLGPAS